MSTEHNTELMEALQEWADDFREKRHPASLTLYRAIQKLRDADSLWQSMECAYAALEFDRSYSPWVARAKHILESAPAGEWIKATDINRPGGWYWVRLGDDDESCPMVVFIALENDGDAAPDFRVECAGENSRTAKRLKQWAERGWEFMAIPMPKTLPLGAERMSEAQCSSPSAPGGDSSLLNSQDQ